MRFIKLAATAAVLAMCTPFAATAQPAPELFFAMPITDSVEIQPVSEIQLTFNTEVDLTHVDLETPDGTKLVLFDVVENNGEAKKNMIFKFELPVPAAAPGQYFINYVADVNRADGTSDTISSHSAFKIAGS